MIGKKIKQNNIIDIYLPVKSMKWEKSISTEIIMLKIINEIIIKNDENDTDKNFPFLPVIVISIFIIILLIFVIRYLFILTKAILNKK